MNVLLTGAAGFIGSHVATALLRRGHEVHAVVREPDLTPRLDEIRNDLTLWQADLLDQSGVRRAIQGAAPDAAIHLAWYTQPGRYLHDRPRNLASLAAGMSLVGHLLDAGCARLLLGGTCLETASPLRPLTFYAVAKRSLHDLVARSAEEDMTVVCGHVYSVYGPGEDERRAVPSITRALLRTETVEVTAATELT